MIGVLTKDTQKDIVREFFELFKTPWEFYNQAKHYDVVICTEKQHSDISAKLLLLYCDESTCFDTKNQIPIKSKNNGCTLESNDIIFPIYGKTITFTVKERPIIKFKETDEIVGFKMTRNETKILRIGFDLFNEITLLLNKGQPKEFATIPTLDIHIALLRQWILEANIPVVEIPPIPAGYDYICCLTHDIDFAGIRNHKFDHTFFGFIYRATLGSFINLITGKTSVTKLLKNLYSVLKLPAVYIGLARDYWMQFDDYKKIEKDAPSTFFFIPFKNDPGQKHNTKGHTWRATKYDVVEIKETIRQLKALGCEIGVHGIDAWVDSEKGRRELKRIAEISGNDEDIGVRMHWLYFSHDSPKILEEAGFYYDSSLGYNDAVGYRNGTTQVFRPVGAQRLLEIPLTVQDSALFYPERMGLTEKEAESILTKLISNALQFGGVLTINWHDRSLAPERLWGNTYTELLKKIRNHKVWFATARDIVRWFLKRRKAFFEDTNYENNVLKGIIICDKQKYTLPHLILKVYMPDGNIRIQTLEFNTIDCSTSTSFSFDLNKAITSYSTMKSNGASHE